MDADNAVLFTVVMFAAVFLDIIYWTVLYDSCTEVTFINFSVHALNAVVLLIDLFLNEIEIELGHSKDVCASLFAVTQH